MLQVWNSKCSTLGVDRTVRKKADMLQLVKVFSFPVLLFASLFTGYAGQYELALTLVVCLVAAVLAIRALRLAQYAWAAELAAIGIVFSPIFLLSKIFLLMGLAFIVACLGLWTALRAQSAPVWEAETE